MPNPAFVVFVGLSASTGFGYTNPGYVVGAEFNKPGIQLRTTYDTADKRATNAGWGIYQEAFVGKRFLVGVVGSRWSGGDWKKNSIDIAAGYRLAPEARVVISQVVAQSKLGGHNTSLATTFSFGRVTIDGKISRYQQPGAKVNVGVSGSATVRLW